MPSGSQATLSLVVRGLLGEVRFVDYGLLTALGLYYVCRFWCCFRLPRSS